MMSLTTPSERTLDRLLTELKDAPPTYAEVGATLGGTLPAGYRHDRYSAVVGAGREGFDRARDGIRAWAPHRAAGFRIHPRSAGIEEGATVLGLLRLGLLTVVFGWRVVYTIDEPNRFGFAYGTLPGHPERGEELFTVVHDTDGTVSYQLVAFSRPVGWARLGAPVARVLQVDVTRRYLRGMQRYVKGEPS